MYQIPGVEEFDNRRRLLTLESCIILTLAEAIIGWQLFVPPVIGLADQGDFLRLLGPLGYAPVPRGPEHFYAYLTRRFIQDPSYRDPRFDQLTSEMIPARIALLLSRAAGHRKQFDLTIFGVTHSLMFLLALARLLYLTRDLPRRLIWALMLLVLTDVGYVAYWNSLYTEPASCLWFLFLLAESISLARRHKISAWQMVRWNIFAMLWITAKAQNAPLAIPLAAFELAMIRRVDSEVRWAGSIGILALICAAAVVYRSVTAQTRMSAYYDLIFYAILPQSSSPAADLQAFVFDPAYARYSGTLTWGPGSGIGDPALVNALLKVGSTGVLRFYITRPRRMWRHLRTILPSAFSLRPEFCGNFDRAARRLPGARSEAFTLWSQVHERWLSPIGLSLVGALLTTVIGGSMLLAGPYRGWIELAMLLAACALLSFFIAGFGDAWDNVKHQYVFNLLLDKGVVFGVVAALELLDTVRKQ